MRVRRASALLNDAITAIDTRLADAKRALPKSIIEEQLAYAWTLLSPVELEFIRDELSRVITSRMYYLENYHCIQPENGVITTLAGIWDHQHMVEDALEREVKLNGQARIIVLKPRQAGITEYASGVMCWRTFFLPHAYTISVAQAPDVAAHIQRKINITYDHLPWWMKPERQYHSKGEFLEFNRKDLSERGINPGLGSVFVTTHAQRTTGVAIGRTVRSLHMSEVSRWPDGEVFTGDIEPSMNAPDTIAIAESTALGEDGFFYNLWTEAVEGDSEWTPVFLPAYRARKFSLPLKPTQLPFTLTPIEAAMKARVKSEERITITDEFFNWRRRRIRSSIKRTGYPYAHYESFPATPTEAFQSSGDAAFPRHKLDEQSQACVRRPRWVGEIVFQGLNAAPKLLLNEVKPEHALEKREQHNRLYLWERPNPRDVYYLGADCGNGNGPDFSAAEIFRAGGGNSPDVQVAEWIGFEQPEAYARILYALGSYYNKCEIAVEYAQEGMTTANYLMGELEYPALYRPRNRDRIGKQLASYMHWQTTSKTKPLMMAKMSETLLEDGIVIRSEYLLLELRKAGMSGSAFEGVGSHDDAAVASCFPAGTKVDTLDGARLIETLRVGDKVLSDDGRVHKVVDHGYRSVDESVVRLKVFGIPDEIICTDEHPIYARTRLGSCPVRISNPAWIKAAELKKNDFVYVPMRKLPPTKFTEDELYLLGWYLSDGWASKRRGCMSFTLSPKDDETRLCQILREMIDAHPTCYLSGPKSSGKHVRRGGVYLKDFGTYKQIRAENVWVNAFLREFGGDPRAKRIHPNIVNSRGTLPLVATFLIGDGSQSSKRLDIKAVQKNKQVLRDIHRILLDHGVWSSLYPDNRDRLELAICGEWVGKFLDAVPWAPFVSPPRVMSHPIARQAPEGYWAQIQRWSKEHFKGDVYNMEIADTHTYLVNGIAVHNCIALFCLRETMPELRLQASYGDGSNTAPTVGARASSGAMVYGVYDQFFRLIGQTRSLANAEATVAANPGYKIKPIPVSKANTPYSVIHHGTSVESEIFRTQGMDSWDITPGVVSQYKGATGRQQGMFMQPGQGAWRKPPGSMIDEQPGPRLSSRVGAGGAAALEAEWLNSMVQGGELGETI